MSPLRGIALKLGAITLFSAMAALVKAGVAQVPTGEAVFFRSFFAMPVIVVWLAMRGDLSTGFRTRHPMGHLWRGLIGVSAMGCGFGALGLLPLPEVTALGYAAPLLTVIFAAILLGERIRLFRITAVVLGLVGVCVVLWPRLTFDDLTGPGHAGRGACPVVGSLSGAGADPYPPDGADRGDLGHCVLFLADRDLVFALLTAPFRLGLAGNADPAGLDRGGGDRRRGADIADLVLSLCRGGAAGAVRLCLDPVCHRDRLGLLRRDSDGDGADRVGDRDGGGADDHLAGTAVGVEAGRGAPFDARQMVGWVITHPTS